MTDLDLLIESSQCGGEGGGGISVNEYVVRLLLLQHVFQPAEHAGGDVVEGLPAFHDVEVVVHRQMEEIDHLIEHLAVLRGEADLVSISGRFKSSFTTGAILMASGRVPKIVITLIMILAFLSLWFGSGLACGTCCPLIVDEIFVE